MVIEKVLSFSGRRQSGVLLSWSMVLGTYCSIPFVFLLAKTFSVSSKFRVCLSYLRSCTSIPIKIHCQYLVTFLHGPGRSRLLHCIDNKLIKSMIGSSPDCNPIGNSSRIMKDQLGITSMALCPILLFRWQFGNNGTC